MFSYKIGIYGSDLHYSVRLMEYMNGHDDIPLKASVFSTWESVREYIGQNDLDLLVLDGKCPEEKSDVPVLYLSEQRNVEDRIFKYQNAGQIAKHITHFLGQKSISIKENGIWLAVYSPVGRCGKTTLSKCLSRYFEHSLYVGLEDFPSDSADDAAQKNGELFLYYLASMNEKILEQIHGCGGREMMDFDSLTATVCYLEWRLADKNLKWFKSLLSEKRHYNAVVFDMGVSALASLDTLQLFDRIIVPALQDEHSKQKLSCFSDFIKKNGDRQLAEKIKYITFSKKDFEEGSIKEMIEKGAI
ncbi:MAG: hypothetical protein NC240_06000 [Clostridium sp.]|nr:hypothetical protein [Clostridium sp.]